MKRSFRAAAAALTAAVLLLVAGNGAQAASAPPAPTTKNTTYKFVGTNWERAEVKTDRQRGADGYRAWWSYDLGANWSSGSNGAKTCTAGFNCKQVWTLTLPNKGSLTVKVQSYRNSSTGRPTYSAPVYLRMASPTSVDRFGDFIKSTGGKDGGMIQTVPVTTPAFRSDAMRYYRCLSLTSTIAAGTVVLTKAHYRFLDKHTSLGVLRIGRITGPVQSTARNEDLMFKFAQGTCNGHLMRVVDHANM